MGWDTEQQILSRINLVLLKEQEVLTAVDSIDLKELTSQVRKLEAGFVTINDVLQSLVKDQSTLASAISKLADAQSSCCTQQTALLNQILKVLIPPPAVSFKATVTLNNQTSTNVLGENNMAKKAAGLGADLQVADNGTFSVNLTFQDADGITVPTPAGLSASYVASDATPGPSALTLTPSADTSSCAGSINQATIQAQQAA